MRIDEDQFPYSVMSRTTAYPKLPITISGRNLADSVVLSKTKEMRVAVLRVNLIRDAQCMRDRRAAWKINKG
jgi:hypothetical protein